MALNAVCLAGLLVANLVPVTENGRLLLRGILEHRQRPRIARRRAASSMPAAPAAPAEPPLCIEYEAWDELAARAFGLMKRGDPVVLQGTLVQRRVHSCQHIATLVFVRVERVDPLPPIGALRRVGGAPRPPAPDQQRPGAGAGAARCACDADQERASDGESAQRVDTPDAPGAAQAFGAGRGRGPRRPSPPPR